MQQLNVILRKFIKQIVTSKQPSSLEKLVSMSVNLVRQHMGSMRDDRLRVTGDLAFNFVRSLFLDNVLLNENITSAILTNKIQTMADFENFTRIDYTERF